MTEREAIAKLSQYSELFPKAGIHYSYDSDWRVEVGQRYRYPNGLTGVVVFGAEPEFSGGTVIGVEIWFFFPYDIPINPINWEDERYYERIDSLKTNFEVHQALNGGETDSTDS